MAILVHTAIILLLNQTPVENTLHYWSRGPNKATQDNPKIEE